MCNNEKIESKEIIPGLCNWASTSLSNIVILAVWFGLVAEMQTANQTEPRGLVQNSSEASAVFCGFSLDWFGLRFFYWVGSVLNTPNLFDINRILLLVFMQARDRPTILFYYVNVYKL